MEGGFLCATGPSRRTGQGVRRGAEATVIRHCERLFAMEGVGVVWDLWQMVSGAVLNRCATVDEVFV